MWLQLLWTLFQTILWTSLIIREKWQTFVPYCSISKPDNSFKKTPNLFMAKPSFSYLLLTSFDTIKPYFVYKLLKHKQNIDYFWIKGLPNLETLSPHHYFLANKALFTVLANTNQWLAKPAVQFWEGKVGWVVWSVLSLPRFLLWVLKGTG